MNDDQGWCWSENTDLGEVLIIARKLSKGDEPTSCFYVNVTHHPRNEVESLLLSQEIRSKRAKLAKTIRENVWSEVSPGGRMFGYTYWVDRKDLRLNWHFGCLFSHPELVRFGLELAGNKSLTPLEPYLKSKGRDISMIKKNFQKSNTQTSYPILWGHQGAMNTLLLQDEFIGYGVPQKGKKSEALHKGYCSNLLVVDRSHINTECLLAMETTTPVLATAFWEIKLTDHKMQPIILLWLNSTYGFFSALGAGANSKGPIYKIKQDHLGDILIPKPPSDESLLQRVADKYAEVRRREFSSFPKEFELAANQQGPRQSIDEFFHQELGLPEISPDLYKILSSEPALTLKRRSMISTTISGMPNTFSV